MIGRIVGFVAGAAIAITGFGMQKPAIFAKYFDFSKLSLGPFAEYKTLVCWMIVAIGVAVALAALQRPSGGAGRKKSAPAMFEPEAAEPSHGSHGPLMMDPEPHHEPAHADAHDDHHDDHGHHDDHHGHHDDHHGHQVDHHEVHTPEPAH